VKLVLKISGKFLSPYDKPLVREYASVVEELAKEHEVAVVVGGGSVARKYIELGSSSKALRDVLGIEVARLNAFLLASHIPKAKKKVPRSAEEFLELWDGERVVVLGGFQPGQSTNAVSLIVAELIGADLVINATTVDAVYDKPPNEPGAKKIKEIKAKELMKLLESEGWSNEPGRYELMDFLALQIISRSKIPVAIVPGWDPRSVLRAVRNKEWGTLVLP